MRQYTFIPVLTLFFLSLVSTGARAQGPAAGDAAATARILLAEQRWEEIVRLAAAAPQRSAELDYCYGMALAKLQRWDEAAQVFRTGAAQAPTDPRFLLELAGLAFRRKQYSEATRELRKALRLDPHDGYANDFLATIYFLDGNLEAALKYWNRAGKPLLENVASDPPPRLDPALLDRAFAFSPAAILHAADFQLTQQRLDQLQVFSSYRFDLLPREDGKFDLLFRPVERNGWGNTKLEAMLRLFRNLPYQTVNPEFFNLGGSAANLVSLFRWDAEKRRLFSSFTAPLRGDPQWRYRVYVDLRKEQWDLAGAFAGTSEPVGNLGLQKAEAGAEIQSLPSARWNWRTGFSLSQRSFRQVGFDPVFAAGFLRDGFELKYLAQTESKLLAVPDRRLTATADAGFQLGRLWASPTASFAKLTGSLKGSWVPVARGDDYATSAQFRWGKTFGQVPFDELFQLGMERDNDLWMRAHAGTRDGMKGNAPLGRDYVLFSWELDKNVHQSAFFKITLGPFFDTGRALDPSPALGSRGWLCDAGLQAKLRLFGRVGVVFSYGKDLRRGRNVFYTAGLP